MSQQTLVVRDYHSEYIRNKEKILLQNKEYRLRNKEKIAQFKKQKYLENKDKIAEYHRKYYLQNKQRIITKSVEYKRRKKTLVPPRVILGHHKQTSSCCSFCKIEAYVRQKIRRFLNGRETYSNQTTIPKRQVEANFRLFQKHIAKPVINQVCKCGAAVSVGFKHCKECLQKRIRNNIRKQPTEKKIINSEPKKQVFICKKCEILYEDQISLDRHNQRRHNV